MPKIYVKVGGLMEDPIYHWELLGEADGNTLREACDNLAKKDWRFALEYDPKTLTYWAWELSLTKKDDL